MVVFRAGPHKIFAKGQIRPKEMLKKKNKGQKNEKHCNFKDCSMHLFTYFKELYLENGIPFSKNGAHNLLGRNVR